MNTARYVYWQDRDKWLGYFEEYPDYVTQGESFEDLREHLKDLFQDLVSCPGRNIIGFDPSHSCETVSKVAASKGRSNFLHGRSGQPQRRRLRGSLELMPESQDSGAAQLIIQKRTRTGASTK